MRARRRMTPWPSGNDPATAGHGKPRRAGRRRGRLGDPEGHGRELILDHVSWLRRVIVEQQLTEEPGAPRDC